MKVCRTRFSVRPATSRACARWAAARGRGTFAGACADVASEEDLFSFDETARFLFMNNLRSCMLLPRMGMGMVLRV